MDGVGGGGQNNKIWGKGTACDSAPSRGSGGLPLQKILDPLRLLLAHFQTICDLEKAMMG